MAKETAEQKLLKILETSGTANTSKSTAIPVKAPRRSLQFSIGMFNGILVLAILGCLAMLGYELQAGSQLLRQQVDFDLSAMGPHADDLATFKPRDISFYAQKIGMRNIFKPYEKEQMDKVSVAAKPDLARKLSKYKLVGVAWLDLPESASVMVEDTTNGMTYFLREGEKLDDVTIKSIYTDRAVFGYENEEITIKL